MCNYVEQDAYVAPTVDFFCCLPPFPYKYVKPLEIQAGIKTPLIFGVSICNRQWASFQDPGVSLGRILFLG